MVAHASGSGIWEVEAGGLEVQSQTQLYGEFKASPAVTYPSKQNHGTADSEEQVMRVYES